jgi:hypothetical protein
MYKRARHSLFVRLLAIATGILVLGASLAAWAPGMAAANPARSPARTVAHGTASYGTAGSRGQVDVRELARTSKVRKEIPARPAIRPVRKTPKADGVAPRTATVSPPIQTTPTAALPSTITTFDGIHQDTALEANVEPPDPYVAVGPDDVVQVVNLMVRITDRNGADAVDFTLPDFFFLPSPDFGDADPRIVYDPLHARWVAIEASWDCNPDPDPQPGDATIGHGYIDIAISNTANPRGTWSVFFRTYNDLFPDYPGLGTSTDKVVVSANLYDMVPEAGPLECIGNTYQGADFTAFDWSDLANGGGLSYAGFDPDPDLFTIRPAIQSPPTVAPVHWVTYIDNGSGWDEGSGTVTGSVLAGTVASGGLSLTDRVSPPLVPGQPRQPGPSTIADAVDERITDAIWQNNELTWVSTYPCTPMGDSAARDCVRVTQLNTTGRTLLQDFLVAQNGEDLYMGGVGVSGNGALHVVWTQSSATATHYPSTYGAYQLPTNAANSLSTPQLLGAGDSTYPGTRWGDYVGVAQDPQDPNAVWQAGEFTDTGIWATNVTQMNISVGSTFVPITPIRLLNTLGGVGLSGKFTANVPRTFQVAGAQVGGVTPIPSNAKAITANLTVTQQNGAGYVSVTPTPTTSPPASTINFPVGDNRANNLTTRLSSDGKLSAVYKALSGKTTHLILDVTGYFLEDNSGATYNSITPVRLLSTPGSVGLPGPFIANMPRTFQVAGVELNGVTPIPSGAIAISGNLTVTRQTASGHVSVTPEPTNAPPTSTLNFPVGDNRANGLVVPLSGPASASGPGFLSAVYKATTGSTVDLILDVTGYYLADLNGDRFYPLNPGRRLNPLAGIPPGIPTFHANEARSIVIAGHVGVPTGATAITGNLTVTQQTRGGYASITPDPTNSPPTSTINFPVGDNRANGVTVPVNVGGLLSLVYKAPSGATTILLLDVTGYFK